jgi:hypothetical protein
MKKWIAGIWLSVLMIAIAGLFWFNQLVYSMPTPVPSRYINVANGTRISRVSELHFKNNKPIFLHFFNPDCPCSRFNIKHFKTLVKEYGNRVNFAVVLMTNKPYTASDINERFGLSLPVIKDDGLAESCGVYSTPQAVLLQSDLHLYFRGNYNKTRYCTDERSNYAKLAVTSLLNNKATVQMEPLALVAYGCKLPDCKN